MTTYKSPLVGLVLAGALLTPGSPVWAGGPENNPRFQKNHPRQTEVLKRADRERGRINNLYKQGKISAQQRDQMLGQVGTFARKTMRICSAASQHINRMRGHINRWIEHPINKR